MQLRLSLVLMIRRSWAVRSAAGLFAAALIFVTALGEKPADAGDRSRALRRVAFREGAAADPPEVTIGERLFLETRFAQFFFANGGPDVNAPLAQGDPVMQTLRTSLGPLEGPFAGRSMNCRNCHLVDDTADAQTRTYADYSRKSLVPLREDGETETARNSPSLVNASLPRTVPFFLHFDGEFTSLEGLVAATLTGRNFGWLPGERAAAVAHVARVIREDNGGDDLASQFGSLSYRVVLAGMDPSIPPELVLPPSFRLDAGGASDGEVLNAVVRLIAAYTRSLEFSRDEAGLFNGSPYDAFLAKNGLPRVPEPGESDLDYSRRLRAAVAGLAAPQFVGSEDGAFGEHDQDFVFGPDELKGLKIFFREPLPETLAGNPRYLSTRTGNCIACHAAPSFTDFSFHNTGATQEAFDEAHGDGAFQRLFIPDRAYRSAHPEEFLPPTELHPAATGRYRSGEVDLGVWNVFGNPDFPGPQASLSALLNPDGESEDAVLRRTIGAFKTPGLRDLSQSGPYLHTGLKRGLEEVLEFYASSATKARGGSLRNAAPELEGMFLGENDIDPLAAFLRALNEDYN